MLTVTVTDAVAAKAELEQYGGLLVRLDWRSAHLVARSHETQFPRIARVRH